MNAPPVPKTRDALALPMNTPEKEQKTTPQKVEIPLAAREAWLYYKILRGLSIAAVVLGLFISGFVYNKISGGDFRILATRPTVLLNILTPFIPAVALIMIAASKHKKLCKILKKQGIGIKSLHDQK